MSYTQKDFIEILSNELKGTLQDEYDRLEHKRSFIGGLEKAYGIVKDIATKLNEMENLSGGSDKE